MRGPGTAGATLVGTRLLELSEQLAVLEAFVDSEFSRYDDVWARRSALISLYDDEFYREKEAE